MPKSRQQLIDDCRQAVTGAWLDYATAHRHARGGEVAIALEAALAATREHVTNAVNAAVEIAKAAYEPKAPNGAPAQPQPKASK